METGIFAPGNDLRNCFTIEWHAWGYPICGALRAELVGFLELLDILTDKSQVHGATPTTDMSWQWHCLQIWDSSRITAASCTSVFVLFLYKDLSKGKTSPGEKKTWHLHPVFVCELLSAAYTVLLCIENTWLSLISYRKSDHWHVRAPSSQWHHWLKLTLLNNTWWLLSNTAQSLMSYA